MSDWEESAVFTISPTEAGRDNGRSLQTEVHRDLVASQVRGKVSCFQNM